MWNSQKLNINFDFDWILQVKINLLHMYARNSQFHSLLLCPAKEQKRKINQLDYSIKSYAQLLMMSESTGSSAIT